MKIKREKKTKSIWIKKLTNNRSFRSFFSFDQLKNNNPQGNGNGKKSGPKPKTSYQLFKQFTGHPFSLSSKLIANQEEIINPKKSYVNTFKLKPTKLGVIKRTASQVADKLVKSPGKNLILGKVNQSSINEILTNFQPLSI